MCGDYRNACAEEKARLHTIIEQCKIHMRDCGEMTDEAFNALVFVFCLVALLSTSRMLLKTP
jgi:hypothetical protein